MERGGGSDRRTLFEGSLIDIKLQCLEMVSVVPANRFVHLREQWGEEGGKRGEAEGMWGEGNEVEGEVTSPLQP